MARWIVSLDGSQPPHTVAAGLHTAGAQVEEVLQQVGIVIISADPVLLAPLRQVGGVASIEADLLIGTPEPPPP